MRNGLPTRGAIIALVGGLTAACGAASADEAADGSEAPPTASSEPVGTDGVDAGGSAATASDEVDLVEVGEDTPSTTSDISGSTAAPAVTASPTTGETTATGSSDASTSGDVDGAAPSDTPTTELDESAGAASGPEGEASGETADEAAALDPGESEEPSFEVGPQVELDLTGVPDAGDPLTGWAAFDRYLADVLIRPGNTAASVAVSIGGDVVHTAAFGVRDPATGDPAEPQDRFRIASISKPITAIVALRLVEEGRIGLDDPVGQLIADHLGMGELTSSARGLTLRQLLTHTSGFGKYQSTFFRGGASSCEDAARQGLRNGAGGGGYVYSNMNFCVAGLAVEALTGLTYEEAAYRRLLGPLGISGMRLSPTFDPGPDEIQHVTTPGRNYMETLGGAGSWIATPSDLVTIFDSLDLSTGGYKPLSLEMVLAMVTPSNGVYGQRGYGLGVISYGDGRFGHTGTIESTHAMVLNRGDGVTFAVTVAGQYPDESTRLERIVNEAFVAGGFVA